MKANYSYLKDGQLVREQFDIYDFAHKVFMASEYLKDVRRYLCVYKGYKNTVDVGIAIDDTLKFLQEEQELLEFQFGPRRAEAPEIDNGCA